MPNLSHRDTNTTNPSRVCTRSYPKPLIDLKSAPDETGSVRINIRRGKIHLREIK